MAELQSTGVSSSQCVTVTDVQDFGVSRLCHLRSVRRTFTSRLLRPVTTSTGSYRRVIAKYRRFTAFTVSLFGLSMYDGVLFAAWQSAYWQSLTVSKCTRLRQYAHVHPLADTTSHFQPSKLLAAGPRPAGCRLYFLIATPRRRRR